MKNEFWKKLVRIYLQVDTSDAVKKLNDLREEIEKSEASKEEKERMLYILDDILKSDNLEMTLQTHAENEVTRFIGGSACQ